MRVITTREASQLTGLSTNKLREWTSRRALIPADVRPKSQGSPAKYSWQTILLLRVAATLRGSFHLELQAHRQVFASLRRDLTAR
jgi:DNA-binding transcriptional MerR regulator